MPRIFISYRRSDSGMFTGRIHDQLKASFGANYVFRDMYNIPAGSDFRSVINKAIASTDVCLVIIGPHWLTRTDAQGKRRLDDPNDFVRIEVEAALKNPRVRVIPVLVDNAIMPIAEDLPSSMAELAYRNAVQVRTDPDFPRDMESLIRQLGRSEGQRVTRSVWLFLPLLLLLVSGYFLFKKWTGTTPLASMLRPPETITAAIHPSDTSIPTILPSETATVVPPTPTPTIEPAGSGEIMVLIAQLEHAAGAQPREVTRFIIQDLKNKPLTDKVCIREYGDTIKTDTQASEVAMQTGATIVIWGQYDDDSSTIYLQLGSLKPVPDLDVDLAALTNMVNVRLRVNHADGETLAYPILSALGFLNNAENNYVGTMSVLMSLKQLEEDVDARKPTPLGNTVAAHTHRATWDLVSRQDIERKSTWSEISKAIDLDANNPYLNVFRALIAQGIEKSLPGSMDSGMVVSSSDDLNTAILYAPKGWVMPYYILGNGSLVSADISGGIGAYTQIIKLQPDYWLPYNQRGYLYFREKNYMEAHDDIVQAVERKPEREWPYVWGILIALRQGRLDEVSMYMSGITEDQLNNPMYVLKLLTELYGEKNATFLGYSMAAVGNFSIRKYDVSMQNADTLLKMEPEEKVKEDKVLSASYAEMYLLKGLIFCTKDEHQSAETAYSRGVEFDPTFTMLYFLRAEARRNQLLQGKELTPEMQQMLIQGIAEDIAMVEKSDIGGTLKPYIEAAQSGQFSCKQITSTK